jgi:hypothetical protein
MKLLAGSQHAINHGGHAAPFFRLFSELPSPGARQSIKLRLAIIF